MKKVSVIIPTHNRGSILENTVLSYCADPSVYEILIVDDGSDKASKTILNKIVSQASNIKLLTQENKGAPAARNYGIAHVSEKTHYIFFGEDDAFVGENAIFNLVNCIDQYNADIAGGVIIPIDSVTAPLDRPKDMGTIVKPVCLNVMRANFKVPTPTPVEVPFMHALFLGRKWVFRETGFDEHYYGNAYREETDFCIEASKKGAKILYCPDSEIFHIEATFGGQRRISNSAYEMAVLKNNWYFLNKQYDYLKNKYGIITPKWCLQSILILRRVYLIIIKRMRRMIGLYNN